MNNRRVLTLVSLKIQICTPVLVVMLQIGRVLGNPALLQEMAQGMELAPGSAAMLRELVVHRLVKCYGV